LIYVYEGDLMRVVAAAPGGAFFAALCLFTMGAGGGADVPLRVAAVTFFRFAGKK
jgi:hypothetical protein